MLCRCGTFAAVGIVPVHAASNLKVNPCSAEWRKRGVVGEADCSFCLLEMVSDITSGMLRGLKQQNPASGEVLQVHAAFLVGIRGLASPCTQGPVL